MATAAEVETAVDALTAQTTTLLDTVSTIKDDVATDIADAVAISTNAAQIPLAQMAVNVIDMQTLLVNLIVNN
jgi:hypothetical protein